MQQLGDAEAPQLRAQLLGCGGDQAAQLVEGTDPVLAGAGAGHPQHPDGLYAAVSRLGGGLGPPRHRRSSRLDGVERIGLAGPAALLAVGPVHLDDAYALVEEVAGQAGAVAAGALHADEGDGAEALQPGQQAAVAGPVGRERLDA